MKIFKKLALIVVLVIGFTHCKSSKETSDMDKTEHTQNIEPTENSEFNTSNIVEQPEETQQAPIQQGRGKQTPLFIRDTYFERETSGLNIYFPMLINKSNYKIENVYFRGMTGKMRSGKASYFATLNPVKKGLIMSNDPNAEYGNTMPTKQEPFPFELKDNECMLSYLDNGETKYFQVYNIVEKK